MSEVTKEEILLIHGLWMGPWVLQWLAWQLREAGFATQSIGIHTVGEGLAQHIERVAEAVKNSRAPRIHLLGHSLGGVVVLRFLELYFSDTPYMVKQFLHITKI